MSSHLTKDEITEYAAGGVSLFQRMRCWAHLRSCRLCKSLLEAEEQEIKAGRELGEILKNYIDRIGEAETTLDAEPKSYLASRAAENQQKNADAAESSDKPLK